MFYLWDKQTMNDQLMFIDLGWMGEGVSSVGVNGAMSLVNSPQWAETFPKIHNVQHPGDARVAGNG